DKPGYPAYLPWILRLSRRGSLLVADNVVREGGVVDTASRDERVQGVRRFNELLAGEPRVSATVIQTVGSKGYDGFAVALVVGESVVYPLFFPQQELPPPPRPRETSLAAATLPRSRRAARSPGHGGRRSGRTSAPSPARGRRTASSA